ncbi:hypothetical protein BDV26DRAFT_253047 [Aspergillus bertholletiae]|uniref:Uncharacterized protein n=1 Tax=Aspergillus bertholletiae TaxID=1226010 RepID=A0A5N7BLV3_9EURO|nr:hypothetical protein BDV26DRAFT_253047 [Aspergillus bertholletiae]
MHIGSPARTMIYQSVDPNGTPRLQHHEHVNEPRPTPSLAVIIYAARASSCYC